MEPGIALLLEGQDGLADSDSGALPAGEFTEGFALLGETLQQRRRFPPIADALLKFAEALIHFFQTYCVGVPHGPAPMRGETVAVEIDDVDVHGTERDAFFEESRAFVHQRVDAAVDDFLRGNLALRDAGFGRPLPN